MGMGMGRISKQLVITNHSHAVKAVTMYLYFTRAKGMLEPVVTGMEWGGGGGA